MYNNNIIQNANMHEYTEYKYTCPIKLRCSLKSNRVMCSLSQVMTLHTLIQQLASIQYIRDSYTFMLPLP